MSDNEGEDYDGNYGDGEDDENGDYEDGNIGEGEYVEDDGEEQEDDEEEVDEETQLRRQMQAMQRRKVGSSGAQRDLVVTALIKHFGSLVSYATDSTVTRDHRGKVRNDEKIYMKLPDAHRHLSTIIKTLRDPLKFNKDFVTFIAKKNWIPNNLRPLLELCRMDDPLTSKNCVILACLLLEMDDNLVRYLKERYKKVRKSSASKAVDGKSGGGDDENEDNNNDDENDDKTKKSIDISVKTTSSGEKLMETSKASECMSALHAIKEGLCSEFANDAICNIFKNAWLSEMNNEQSDAETKKELKLCFIYIRRLFLIEPISDLMANSGSGMTNALKVNFNYIIQLRPILSVIPFICSDLCESVVGDDVKPNAYHNDWLKDIVTILAIVLKNFSPRDMLDVYKDGKLINFGNGMLDADVENVERAEEQHIVVPESIQKRNTASELSKGKLKEMIEMQKESRKVALQGRHNRFGGVYHRFNSDSSISASGAANNETSSIAIDKDLGNGQSKLVLRNPFQKEQSLPEARTKRNVRNMTFAVETVLGSNIHMEPMRLDEGQKALVVAASLVDMMVNFSADDMTAFPGIRHLMKRVNEDKRRDDNKIDNDAENLFFQVLYKCLSYNRMKLNVQKKQFEERQALAQNTRFGQMSQDAADAVWEPNFQNVIDCLNIRTVNRVTSTMERLIKIDKDFSQVIYSMEVYKEQICYIKILLESDLEAHNYIAMFNLSRLFYSPSGRLDMLDKLIKTWRPGVYDRKHLITIVEILHETMKTLRFAKAKFFDESYASSVEARKKSDESSSKKKKKKYVNKDMDGLVLSCHSFDVDEYFKRLVTNHTIRMYSRLLKEYKSLDPTTIHYIYVFFQDICKFKLERRSDGRSPEEIERLAGRGASSSAAQKVEPLVTTYGTSYNNSNSNSKSRTSNSNSNNNNTNNNCNSNSEDELTLGYMLLNINTFCVFSDILSDTSIEKNKFFDPLVRLLRSLVRKFVQAANRNHLMYVEILFQHAHPHDLCETLDNVYDATTFYESYTNSNSRYGSGSKSKSKGGDRSMQLSDDSDSDSNAGSYSGSDEDDDNNGPSKKKSKKERKEEKKIEKRAKKDRRDKDKDGDKTTFDDNEDPEDKIRGMTQNPVPASAKKSKVIVDDEDEEFDMFNPPALSNPNPDTLAKNKKAKKSKRTRKPFVARAAGGGEGGGGLGAGRSRGKKWTEAEDNVLRAQYPIYAGMSSAYDVLSQDVDLITIGNNRDAKQVERRVRDLGLDNSATGTQVDDDDALPDDSFFFSDDDAQKMVSSDNDNEDNDNDNDDADDDDDSDDSSVDIDGTFPQDTYDDPNAMPLSIASAALLSPQQIVPRGRGSIISPGGFDAEQDNSIFDDIFKDHEDDSNTTASGGGKGGKLNAKTSNILDSIDMSGDDSDKEMSQVKRKRLVRRQHVKDDSDDDF